jgi:hypothetical protein
VRLPRLKRPKIVCSPYADFRSRKMQQMLLDLDHMTRGEQIWENKKEFKKEKTESLPCSWSVNQTEKLLHCKRNRHWSRNCHRMRENLCQLFI